MRAPLALHQAIETGTAAVRAHPSHHLERRYRLAIWAALGPKLDRARPDGDVGLRRRTHLERLSVLRVLPLWEARFPDVTLPQKLLAETEQVLAGQFDRKQVARDLGYSWGEMDAISWGYTDKIYAVGYAAHHVLYQAHCDSAFDPDPTTASWRLADDEVSPYYKDAAYLASLAAAGDAPIPGAGDNAKRLAFWEWWLSEAVPQAWASVPDGPG